MFPAVWGQGQSLSVLPRLGAPQGTWLPPVLWAFSPSPALPSSGEAASPQQGSRARARQGDVQGKGHQPVHSFCAGQCQGQCRMGQGPERRPACQSAEGCSMWVTSRYEDAGWRPFWALRGRAVFMLPRLLLASDPENEVWMPTCPESSDHHPCWDRLKWYHFLSVPVLPLVGPDLTVYTSWAPLLERVQRTAPPPSRHCSVNSKL